MSPSSNHGRKSEAYDPQKQGSGGRYQALERWAAARSESIGRILGSDSLDSKTSQSVSCASIAGPVGSHELLSYISSGFQREVYSGRTAILSNGGGAFAVQLAEYLGRSTVVSPDAKFIRLAKEKPLGSRGAVQKYLDSKPTQPLGTIPYIFQGGVTYRTGSLDHTCLPSSTFSLVVIEQGHLGDLRSTLAEACRIARLGGTILLISYANMRVISKSRPAKDEILVSHINDVLLEMTNFLNRYRALDEQLLKDDFRTIGHPLSDANNTLPHYRKRMIMRSIWSLSELAEYMASWPAVRRLERSGSLQRLLLWNFGAALKRHWGSTKTRRVVNWRVTLHSMTVQKVEAARGSKVEA